MSGRHRPNGGGGMNDAAGELASKISSILFEMNNQLSALSALFQASQDTGMQLQGLEVRSLEVSKAAADLTSTIPRELQQTIARYRVDIQSLEDYLFIL